MFVILIWRGLLLDSQLLRVAYLDVGQGDSIYIETPKGVQVLIDGGPDGSVLRELSKLMPFYDRSIDIVIATHPDHDHIGGLPEIFTRFKIDTYITTGTEGTSGTYRYLQELVHQEGAQIVIIDSPTSIQIGSEIRMDILFPTFSVAKFDSNASSLIIELVHNQNEFLFTGDAPKSIERYLVSVYEEQLEADVLKVGHHGSKTSSDLLFLEMVNPKYSIISAERDSRYGHPHRDVLERLQQIDTDILATSEEGTILFLSDGINLIKK